MKINIGANVECRGERVGTVQRLILDPTSFDLRQLVVEHGRLLTARQILVPVGQILEAKEKVVTLDMSVQEFEALPDFEEAVYVPLDRLERYTGTQASLSGIEPALTSFYFVPQFPVPAAAAKAAADRSAEPYTKEIKAGMEVYAGEHKIGEISKVIVDSSDKRVTSFVIARGWVFTRDFEVPADWVRSIEGNRLLLNRTKAQIKELDKDQQRQAGSGGEQSA